MAIIVSVPTSRAGKYGEMAGDAMQAYVDARQKAEQLKRQRERQDAQDQRAQEQHDYSMAQNRLTAAIQEWTSGGMVGARPTLGQFLPGGAPTAPAAGSVSTQSYGGPDPLPGTQGPMAPEQAAWQAGQMGAAANINLSAQRTQFGLDHLPDTDPSVVQMSSWSNMVNSTDPAVQTEGFRRRDIWAGNLIPGLTDSMSGLFQGLEEGSDIREWAESQYAAILQKVGAYDPATQNGAAIHAELLEAKLLFEMDIQDELRRTDDIEKYLTNNAPYQEYIQQVREALAASVGAETTVVTGYDDYGNPIKKIDSGKQRQIEEAQSKMRKILEMQRDALSPGGLSPSEVANKILATSMDTRALMSELESRGLSAGVPGADPTAFSPGGGGGTPIAPGTVVPVGGQGTPGAFPPPSRTPAPALSQEHLKLIPQADANALPEDYVSTLRGNRLVSAQAELEDLRADYTANREDYEGPPSGPSLDVGIGSGGAAAPLATGKQLTPKEKTIEEAVDVLLTHGNLAFEHALLSKGIDPEKVRTHNDGEYLQSLIERHGKGAHLKPHPRTKGFATYLSEQSGMAAPSAKRFVKENSERINALLKEHPGLKYKMLEDMLLKGKGGEIPGGAGYDYAEDPEVPNAELERIRGLSPAERAREQEEADAELRRLRGEQGTEELSPSLAKKVRDQLERSQRPAPDEEETQRMRDDNAAQRAARERLTRRSVERGSSARESKEDVDAREYAQRTSYDSSEPLADPFADMPLDPIEGPAPDRMQRKEQARISNREIVAGTERAPDPGEFVEGYDLGNAKKAGLVPDRTGHWPSRIPEGKEKGLILKSQDHETFYLTVEGEKAAGMVWYYGPKTGRWYTFPKGRKAHRPDLVMREPKEGVHYKLPYPEKGTPPERPASGKQQVDPAWLKKQREEELAREMQRLGGYGSPAVDEATGEQQGRRRRPGDRRRSRN